MADVLYNWARRSPAGQDVASVADLQRGRIQVQKKLVGWNASMTLRPARNAWPFLSSRMGADTPIFCRLIPVEVTPT